MFSLPTLPRLPSLPSLRSLLDSEPQVLYPPSATNTPAPSPSRNARTKILPPVPEFWVEERERERERERGRRNSIASSSRLAAPSINNLPRSNPHGPATKRPGHQRAHSALPSSSSFGRLSTPASSSSSPSSTPLPLGRLTEFSRNKLASTSALSLPTLAEMEVDEDQVQYDGPGRGELKRRDSKISIASSSYTNNSDVSSLPPSPRRTPRHGHGQMMSLPNPGNVPPPIPRAEGGGGRISISRPAAPRCYSAMDVRPTHSSNPSPNATSARGGLSRRSSYSVSGVGAGPRITESTASSSQVSDVAVLASWSFPTTPPSAPSARPQLSRHGTSTSTSNLAERLKSLAVLDTQPSSLGLSVHVDIEPLPPLPALVPRYGSGIGGGMQQKLAHRYTHSSPNLAIGAGARRGLRQPIPLGSNSNNILINSVHNGIPASGLSSSPGGRSLLSSSDTSSSDFGPISPASSLHSLPPQNQAKGDSALEQTKEGRWYDPRRAWSRRASTASISVSGGDKGVLEAVEDDGEVIKVIKREEGEEEEEEAYLDYDDI